MAAGFGLRAFLGLAVRVGVALRVFGGMVGHWRGAYTLGSRGKPSRELPTLRRVLKAEWNRAKQLLRLRLSVRLARTAKERGTIDRVLQVIDEAEAGAARRSGDGRSSVRLRFARRLGRCRLAGAAPASSRPQSSPKTSPLGLRSHKDDLERAANEPLLISVVSLILIITPIVKFQPVHESMRPRRVRVRAHDVADDIDAEYLCADRALHIKTTVLTVFGSKKTVRIYENSDCVGLIVTVHTDDIAPGVDVPTQREEVPFKRECGRDDVSLGCVAHTRGQIKPGNLAGRRDAITHGVRVMAASIIGLVRSCKDSEFAVMQEETMHGRHGLVVFVKASHDVAFRRDTHREGVAEWRSWMIEVFRRYVDGIEVEAFEVSESMRHGTNVVMSDDGSLLADAPRDRPRASGHINARIDAVSQQEPVSPRRTRFSGHGIDACDGANIGADNIALIVDASRPGRRRAGVLDGCGYERFRFRCPGL